MLGWDVLSHCPPSPDLAHSNFHLFPADGKTFVSDGDGENSVQTTKNALLCRWKYESNSNGD